MNIHSAELNDIDELAVLFDGYRVFYDQPSDLALAKSFLNERIEKQQSIIFLARNDQQKAVGFVQLYPIFSSVSAKQSLLLNDLFVDESARGTGAGKALMNAAKDYANETQACWIMLQTHISNKKAQGLYESLGYQRDEECYYYYLS